MRAIFLLELHTHGGYSGHMWKLVLIIFSAIAHPVIYQDGWVYQGSFMPQMNEMRVGYSLTSRIALVANGAYYQNLDEYQDYTVGANFLLKRWLAKDSQANIYAGAHVGHFEQMNNDGTAGHLFLQSDWENQDHYVLAKVKGVFYEDEEVYDTLFRYGFSPYVAGMEEIQTWLIFQAQYLKEQSRSAIITPMLRFFYRNVLWEVGYSTRGQSFLTLMVHY